MQDSWNVPATPGLNSFSEDDCSMPAVDEWRPRPRRPLAHPQRCDGSTVALFAYAAAPSRSSTPAGARAASLRQDDDGRARFSGRLRYYLPEGWCSSYKFTVFERSYVVQLDSHGSEQFCLARPVTASLADAACDFELVWPVPLEPSILDAVAHACDARQEPTPPTLQCTAAARARAARAPRTPRPTPALAPPARLQATKRKPESAAAAELGALSSMHTKLRRLSVASHGPQPPQLHPQPPQPQHHVARGMWHVPGNALQ